MLGCCITAADSRAERGGATTSAIVRGVLSGADNEAAGDEEWSERVL